MKGSEAALLEEERKTRQIRAELRVYAVGRAELTVIAARSESLWKHHLARSRVTADLLP